ncbi:hypothetical protein PaeCFBP13512_22470, partial [Paenibacillus sp. CFBP13512]|uniref:hypothetical protein n=1 Tax=Paenibacillus sp. CFBP13512 TaxID=2184007 RepID=UPI0010C10627
MKDMYTGIDGLEQALLLWADITGISPEKTGGTFTVDQWRIREMNNELKESLAYDPTKITTIMLLECYLNDFIDNRSLSLRSIVEDTNFMQEYFTKIKKLASIISSEDILKIKSEFQKNIISSLNHYGVTKPNTFEMVNDLTALSFLRRDAFKSMHTLECHQFLQGTPEDNKPLYHQDVYQFWDINSLIYLLAQSPSGICLSLIKDPFDSSSYFVFGIRNGGTISILTDKDRESHPLQKYMSRRPDRDLASRMWKHHFPYSVMDIEIEDSGFSAYAKKRKQDEVISYQTEFISIKKISDLEPNEMIWVSMLFSQIEKKFWKEAYKAPELSYTTDMITQKKIIKVAQELPGIIEDYKPLEAPLITTSLLTDPNIDLDWDYPAEGINSWMEKRYKDLVSDEILNQNGENDNKILIGEADQSEELITSLQGHYNEVDISTNHFLIVDKDTFWEFNVFGKSVYKRSIELKSADPSKFGTENEILREQRWFARYNQASIVNYAAQQEFIKRKSEMLDWVKERIYKNLDFLYQSIAQGELKIIKPK